MVSFSEVGTERGSVIWRGQARLCPNDTGLFSVGKATWKKQAGLWLPVRSRKHCCRNHSGQEHGLFNGDKFFISDPSYPEHLLPSK